MAVKNIVLPIPLSSIASSGMSSSYQLLSATAGIPHSCIMIRIVNNSNKDVTLSYDGTNDHDYIPTMTSVLLEFQTNSQPQNQVCSLALGTKLYVKGTAGTGSVYLSGFYQPQGQ
jgi:hypothetical protein